MSSAIISPSGVYRYRLDRFLFDSLAETPEDAIGRRAVFVMLNPSTADADTDDPTVRRCMDFARRIDCDTLTVVNLFAWRATDPKELLDRHRKGYEIVGKDTDEYIRQATESASEIVVAWGATIEKFGKFGRKRVNQVLDILTWHGGPVWCFGATKALHPRHPLYLAKDTAQEIYL